MSVQNNQAREQLMEEPGPAGCIRSACMHVKPLVTRGTPLSWTDRRKGTASRERMEYPKAKREENDD